MRLISIDLLKEGDKLCTPVYTASGVRILTDGVPLNNFYIEKIKQTGIKLTYIEDERFGDVCYKEPINSQTMINAMKVYNYLLENLPKGKEINNDELKNTARAIVDDVRSTGTPVIVHHALYPAEEDAALHAINTAIIATAMGSQTNLNYGQICDLCLGAFIHDIGRGRSANDENPLHPQVGFDALRKSGELSLNAITVAFQHHEDFNGKGFPRKLKGTNISEFSRIVSIADYFNTLTSGFKGKTLPYAKAYEETLNNENIKFDPELIKIFKSSVQIYFNGTLVLLSDGTQGIVERQTKGKPLRPVVKLFSEVMPDYYEEVDLSTNINLRIEKEII